MGFAFYGSLRGVYLLWSCARARVGKRIVTGTFASGMRSDENSWLIHAVITLLVCWKFVQSGIESGAKSLQMFWALASRGVIHCVRLFTGWVNMLDLVNMP